MYSTLDNRGMFDAIEAKKRAEAGSGAPSGSEKSSDDVTAEMRPTDALGIIAYRWAENDAWCDWVPRWARELYGEKGERIGRALRDHGITDDMVKPLSPNTKE